MPSNQQRPLTFSRIYNWIIRQATFYWRFFNYSKISFLLYVLQYPLLKFKLAKYSSLYIERRWVHCPEICIIDEIFLRNVYSEVSGFGVVPSTMLVDCGANVGFFSLKHLKNNCTIIAVEPDSDNFGHLAHNLGSYGGVSLLKKAVMKESGKARLLISNSVTHTVTTLDAPHTNKREVEIDAISLDDLGGMLNGKTDVLLKIDIEGAEEDALLGGLDFIKKYGPRIIIETHSVELEKGVDSILTKKCNYSRVHAVDMVGNGVVNVIYYLPPEKD